MPQHIVIAVVVAFHRLGGAGEILKRMNRRCCKSAKIRRRAPVSNRSQLAAFEWGAAYVPRSPQRRFDQFGKCLLLVAGCGAPPSTPRAPRCQTRFCSRRRLCGGANAAAFGEGTPSMILLIRRLGERRLSIERMLFCRKPFLPCCFSVVWNRLSNRFDNRGALWQNNRVGKRLAR